MQGLQQPGRWFKPPAKPRPRTYVLLCSSTPSIPHPHHPAPQPAGRRCRRTSRKDLNIDGRSGSAGFPAFGETALPPLPWRLHAGISPCSRHGTSASSPIPSPPALRSLSSLALPAANTSVTLVPMLPWKMSRACNELRKSAQLLPLASSLAESRSEPAPFSPHFPLFPQESPFCAAVPCWHLMQPSRQLLRPLLQSLLHFLGLFAGSRVLPVVSSKPNTFPKEKEAGE